MQPIDWEMTHLVGSNSRVDRVRPAKAAEGRPHSKTLRVRGAAVIRAGVPECAQPSRLRGATAAGAFSAPTNLWSAPRGG